MTKKLTFTPNNDLFETLIRSVSKQLCYDEAIGVSDVNQMEVIVNQQEVTAGIEFHHPLVSLNYSKFWNGEGEQLIFL